MRYTADILMHPVPKARPRVGRVKAYTPETTKAAEEELAFLYRAKCKPQPDYIRPVKVHVDVHTESGRGDLDNYTKLVLDALNGIAWKDDKQVIEIHARRFYDTPEGYHVEVEYL